MAGIQPGPVQDPPVGSKEPRNPFPCQRKTGKGEYHLPPEGQRI